MIYNESTNQRVLVNDFVNEKKNGMNWVFCAKYQEFNTDWCYSIAQWIPRNVHFSVFAKYIWAYDNLSRISWMIIPFRWFRSLNFEYWTNGKCVCEWRKELVDICPHWNNSSNFYSISLILVLMFLHQYFYATLCSIAQ